MTVLQDRNKAGLVGGDRLGFLYALLYSEKAVEGVRHTVLLIGEGDKIGSLLFSADCLIF